MKKILFHLFIIFIITACSKSSSSNSYDQYLGKWTLLKARVKATTNGTVASDTIMDFANGSYLDFRKEGDAYKVYSYSSIGGSNFSRDTSNFSVNGMDITLTNSSGAAEMVLTVLSISNTAMTTYHKDLGNVTTNENWTNLTK